MNHIILFQGMIISVLIFSGIFSLILWYKKIEPKINFNYSFLAFFTSVYIYFLNLNAFTTQVDVFIFNNRIINIALILAGVFFLFLLEAFTNYKSRLLLWVLQCYLILLGIINFFLPNGLIYKKIYSFESITFFGNIITYRIIADLTIWIWFVILFLCLITIHIIRSVRYYWVTNNREEARIFLAALLFGVVGLLIKNLMVAFGYGRYFFIDGLSLLGFIFIIGHRNYKNIILQASLRNRITEIENRFKKVIDGAPIGFTMYELNANDELIFLNGNSMASSILKTNFDKKTGKRIEDAFQGIENTDLPERYREVAKTGIPWHCILSPSIMNETITVELWAFKIDTRQIAIMISDITENKRNESELIQQKQLISQLLENVPDKIYFKDRESKFIAISKSFMKELNIESTDQIIGKTDFDIFDINHAQSAFNDEIHIMETGIPIISKEEKELLFGRDERWVNTTKMLWRGANGEIKGTFGLSRDITEKKLAEAEVLKQTYLIRQLLEATPDLIYFKDLESKIIDCSRSFYERLGFNSVNDVLDKTDFDFYDRQHAEEAFNDEQQIIKTGIPIINKEEFETWPRGEYHWNLTTKVPLKNSDGRIVGTIGVSRDITKEKKAGEALLESEIRFKDLAESTFEGIVIAEKGLIVDVNSQMANLVGYSRDEIIGSNIFKFIEQQYHDLERKKVTENDLDPYELKLRKKDGSVFDIEARARSMNREGKVYRVTALRDITEQKTMEDALKTSENNFRRLFEAAPYGILIVENEEEQKMIEVNKTYLELMNLRREDMIGKSAKIFSESDITKKIDEVIEREGRVNNLEFTMTINGAEKYFFISIGAIDYDNKPASFITLEDITDIKKSKIELQSAKNFIEYVINELPIAIISIDENCDVTLYNRTAQKMITQEKEFIHNSHVFEKFPELHFIKDLLEKSNNNKEYISDTKSVTDIDGNIIFYSIGIAPLRAAEGLGSLIMIENVTHKRMMDQVMIQSEKMLSVAGLAAGMAHEINNPLGTIVQGCQNIKRRISDQLPKNLETAKLLGLEIEVLEKYFNERQIFEILNSIHNAAEKASEIIKNMLQFSRRSESRKMMYSLSKLIDETLDLAYSDYDLKKRFDFRKIKINKEYEENIPDIRLTVTEIQQVIFNILQNAAQAIKMENHPTKKPKIFIRLKQEISFVVLEIEDNGPGMDEKTRNRIFEPFFTTKDVGEGTGLGLSVSYMIITTNHGGSISVDSQPGKGSKFTIKLQA